MASGSRQSGLESRSESTIFDPTLTSWMTREPLLGNESSDEEDEAKRKEKDPEGELRELFRIFDKNHDNTVRCSELGKMLCCLGMPVTDADVATIMKELDKNGNGRIEYREFKTFIQDEMRRFEEIPDDQTRAVRLAFKVFDLNSDGVIDENELRSALKNLGEPLSEQEIDEMMKDAAVDEDGKIKYEEFIRVWLGAANQ